MNESNNIDAFQNILNEIEKTKEKLENQLKALLDFKQQLIDYLSCKDL